MPYRPQHKGKFFCAQCQSSKTKKQLDKTGRCDTCRLKYAGKKRSASSIELITPCLKVSRTGLSYPYVQSAIDLEGLFDDVADDDAAIDNTEMTEAYALLFPKQRANDSQPLVSESFASVQETSTFGIRPTFSSDISTPTLELPPTSPLHPSNPEQLSVTTLGDPNEAVAPQPTKKKKKKKKKKVGRPSTPHKSLHKRSQKRYVVKAQAYVKTRIQRLIRKTKNKFNVDVSVQVTHRTENTKPTVQTIPEQSNDLQSSSSPCVDNVDKANLKSIDEHVARLAHVKLKHFLSRRALQDVLGTKTGVGELLPPGVRDHAVETKLQSIRDEMASKITLQKGTEKYDNFTKVKYAMLSLKEILQFLLSLPEYANLRNNQVFNYLQNYFRIFNNTS